jgi:hypothetical protein
MEASRGPWIKADAMGDTLGRILSGSDNDIGSSNTPFIQRQLECLLDLLLYWALLVDVHRQK